MPALTSARTPAGSAAANRPSLNIVARSPFCLSGFSIRDIAPHVDFLGPHVYPMDTDVVRQHLTAAFVCELAGFTGRPGRCGPDATSRCRARPRHDPS